MELDVHYVFMFIYHSYAHHRIGGFTVLEGTLCVRSTYRGICAFARYHLFYVNIVNTTTRIVLALFIHSFNLTTLISE